MKLQKRHKVRKFRLKKNDKSSREHFEVTVWVYFWCREHFAILKMN